MNAKIILLIFLLPFNLFAAARFNEGFADLVENVSPAVVNISTEQKVSVKNRREMIFPHPFEEFREFFDAFPPMKEYDDNGSNKAISLGSGFIIDKSGIIVTNRHVITFRNNELSDNITITLHDNRQLKAKVLGTDAASDLAVLKVDAKQDLPFLEFGDSGKMRVGDIVLAIGNAFGLGTSVSSGVVSAFSRNISIGERNQGIDFIQTDAAINRGNSGGPLFDINGKVIGINFAIISPSGGNVGVAFAIPANIAAPIVERLAKGEKIERPYIGVTYQTVTERMADVLGEKTIYGAIITDIEKNSPAENAGIVIGDIILEINGEKVTRNNDLLSIVSKLAVGEIVDIKILRNQKQNVTLKAKLGKRGNDSNVDDVKEYKEFGLRVKEVPEDIKKKYNIKGVMVIGVDTNNDSNIRKGDVIIMVGNKEVNNLDHFDNLINDELKKKKDRIFVLINQAGNQVFTIVKKVAQ